MTFPCSVLSVVDKRMSRYPLCIVDEEEFMIRLRLFSNSGQTADSLKMEELPGEIIREIAIEQLTSGLTRLKSAASFNLAVKRGTAERHSSTDIQTGLGPVNKTEVGTFDIGSETWPSFSKESTRSDEFNPVGFGELERSEGSQNLVETPTCESERRPESPKQGPYTCSVCDKKFHELSLLKQHTIGHAVTLPGFCTTPLDTKGHNQVNTEMETDTDMGQSEAEPSLLEISMDMGDNDTGFSSEADSNKLSSGIEQSASKCSRKQVKESPTNLLGKELDAITARVQLAKDFCSSETDTGGGGSVIWKKKGAHTCTFCPRRFSSIPTLQSHLSKHTEKKFVGKSLKCDNCGEVYFRERFFKKHFCPNKVDSRRFSCDVCSKSYFSQYELVVHTRTHSGEKPFVCDFCGKGCVSKGALKTHRSVHTGEKPYLCSTCGKAFSHKRGALNHEITHTGVKANVCDVCGKAYHLKKQLRKHELIHTGQKPHMCHECGRSFLRKKNLTEHLRIHAGVKPYVCQYCGWKFTKQYPLSYHIKSKHKDKMDC